MKKSILISLFGGIVGMNYAQTLNQATHAPAIGDVYSFQYADPASLPSNLGNPGAGSVFNFSGLSIYPSVITSSGVTVSSTGSVAAYPGANVAVKTGTDNSFYNSQSSYLQYLGGSLTIGGYPMILNFSSPAVYGVYPMALGTTNTSTVSGTINAFSNNGSFTGTVSFTANATGTLILPGSVSYSNVIRVETHSNLNYTISIVTGTLSVIQYDYYAPSYSNFPNPNNNWPVLSVQQSTLYSSFSPPSYQTTVTINSNYQTLGVNDADAIILSGLKFVPNPANENFSIINNTAKSDVKIIQVFDISGKMIFATTQDKVDCSKWENGVYFIRVEDKNGRVVTERVVVQH